MTTLNAMANKAYHDLVDTYEREHEDSIWPGFDHQRDAYETGWEGGYTSGGRDMSVMIHTRLLAQLEDAITSERKNALEKAIQAVEELAP